MKLRMLNLHFRGHFSFILITILLDEFIIRVLTSLTAVESATQEKVISHDWTTSAGLFPLNAPDLTKSRH